MRGDQRGRSGSAHARWAEQGGDTARTAGCSSCGASRAFPELPLSLPRVVFQPSLGLSAAALHPPLSLLSALPYPPLRFPAAFPQLSLRFPSAFPPFSTSLPSPRAAAAERWGEYGAVLRARDSLSAGRDQLPPPRPRSPPTSRPGRVPCVAGGSGCLGVGTWSLRAPLVRPARGRASRVLSQGSGVVVCGV